MTRDKVFVFDTNVPINSLEHVTNFLIHKNNTLVMCPDLLISEIDSAKRNARGNQGRYNNIARTGKFFGDITSHLTFTKSMALNAAGTQLGIDFSLSENEEKLVRICQDYGVRPGPVKGQLLFLKNITNVEATEKSINFMPELGPRDLSYLLTTMMLSEKNPNKDVRLITLDNNVHTTGNLNDITVEFPTGGLKGGTKNISPGYQFLPLKELFTPRLAKSIKEKLLLGESKVDPTHINEELMRTISPEEYVIFTEEKGEEERYFLPTKSPQHVKLGLQNNSDNPWYEVPSSTNIYRFSPRGPTYNFLRLDKRILEKNFGKYASFFPVHTFEHLLLADTIMNPEKRIIIIDGPAGTGKTHAALHLSLIQALYLREKKGLEQAQVWITKTLEALGGQEYPPLPGDVAEKEGPFYASTTELLEKITATYMRNRKKIKDLWLYKPMFGFRGVTIEKGVSMIVDEAQNLSPYLGTQLLQRLGPGRFIFVGDNTQVDSRNLDSHYNALIDFLVKHYRNISFDNEHQREEDRALQRATTHLRFENTVRTDIMRALQNRYLG